MREIICEIRKERRGKREGRASCTGRIWGGCWCFVFLFFLLVIASSLSLGNNTSLPASYPCPLPLYISKGRHRILRVPGLRS
jgi:hypothetical protein